MRNRTESLDIHLTVSFLAAENQAETIFFSSNQGRRKGRASEFMSIRCGETARVNWLARPQLAHTREGNEIIII